MKKTFRLENLDCANCAAKMERIIGKIQGVSTASVQFMTQRLTIEAEEMDMERILGEAAQAIGKIERGCKIVF